MMKLSKWFGVLFILACNAKAANWLSVGTLGDANQHAYDASKLSFEAEEVTYWRRIMFSIPIARAQGNVTLGLYRERINCRKHTLQLLDWLLYDAQNRVVERANGLDGEMLPIVPDTIGDAFSTKLCPMVPPVTIPQAQENIASAPVISNKAKSKAPQAKQPTVPVVPKPPAIQKEQAASSQGLPVLLGDDMIMIPGNGEKRVTQ
ncbi:hypothetical protein LIN78_09060 [Leeia sp. TBRC 13508]|uniref:Surface-adhesin protein E-like domain-containing protein n=1 Tax=Leeia speluncae TaxID=2884804 RepID=A0ABS8D666_9NEIS|nr:surface-adhesin E family protein [Leeia speluncae]MCB6183698.1 hypothetical protein [Leeia speluncae]